MLTEFELALNDLAENRRKAPFFREGVDSPQAEAAIAVFMSLLQDHRRESVRAALDAINDLLTTGERLDFEILFREFAATLGAPLSLAARRVLQGVAESLLAASGLPAPSVRPGARERASRAFLRIPTTVTNPLPSHREIAEALVVLQAFVGERNEMQRGERALEFVKMLKASDTFERYADLWAYRVLNVGKLFAYSGRVVAWNPLDVKTTQFCRSIHGKEIDIEGSRELVDLWAQATLENNHTYAEGLWPLYDARYGGGLPIGPPPYHYHCRTVLREV